MTITKGVSQGQEFFESHYFSCQNGPKSEFHTSFNNCFPKKGTNYKPLISKNHTLNQRNINACSEPQPLPFTCEKIRSLNISISIYHHKNLFVKLLITIFCDSAKCLVIVGHGPTDTVKQTCRKK